MIELIKTLFGLVFTMAVFVFLALIVIFALMPDTLIQTLRQL